MPEPDSMIRERASDVDFGTSTDIEKTIARALNILAKEIFMRRTNPHAANTCSHALRISRVGIHRAPGRTCRWPGQPQYTSPQRV
jgi:hypothetical protein